MILATMSSRKKDIKSRPKLLNFEALYLLSLSTRKSHFEFSLAFETTSRYFCVCEFLTVSFMGAIRC
jgi:hypothetical protein